VNENTPTLIGRRWSTLSPEERAGLPVGTVLQVRHPPDGHDNSQWHIGFKCPSEFQPSPDAMIVCLPTPEAAPEVQGGGDCDERDATIADLRAQVAAAVTDTRAKIGAFLRGFEATSYDLSESDYAEAIEEGTYEESPMIKPLSALLAEAEAKGRREMRDYCAWLAQNGWASPVARDIAGCIRALPDTAPERTRGEG